MCLTLRSLCSLLIMTHTALCGASTDQLSQAFEKVEREKRRMTSSSVWDSVFPSAKADLDLEKAASMEAADRILETERSASTHLVESDSLLIATEEDLSTPTAEESISDIEAAVRAVVTAATPPPGEVKHAPQGEPSGQEKPSGAALSGDGTSESGEDHDFFDSDLHEKYGSRLLGLYYALFPASGENRALARVLSILPIRATSCFDKRLFPP